MDDKKIMKTGYHYRNLHEDWTARGRLGRQAEPEVRPEVVARGRALASDSSYPPFELCERVASDWLDSVELAALGCEIPGTCMTHPLTSR